MTAEVEVGCSVRGPMCYSKAAEEPCQECGSTVCYFCSLPRHGRTCHPCLIAAGDVAFVEYDVDSMQRMVAADSRWKQVADDSFRFRSHELKQTDDSLLVTSTTTHNDGSKTTTKRTRDGQLIESISTPPPRDTRVVQGNVPVSDWYSEIWGFRPVVDVEPPVSARMWLYSRRIDPDGKIAWGVGSVFSTLGMFLRVKEEDGEA